MSKKRKILFAGASGYGNIGDESYKIVIQKYLGQEYEIAFDSPYPDEKMIEWADEIVIGGGGLIYNNPSHVEYMFSYLKNKPYSFLSCGVQIEGEEKTIEIAKEQIKSWKAILDNAKFMTLRSESCLNVIKSVSSNRNIFWFPDLSYLTPEAGYSIIPSKSNIVIVTEAEKENPLFKDTLQEFKKDTSNLYFLAFSRDDMDITGELRSEITPFLNHKARLRISPQEAVSCLKNANKVLTCRYHGYVLGRAAGLSENKIIVTDKRYKSQVEDHNQDISLATKHFDIFKNFIIEIIFFFLIDYFAPIIQW